jgi:hypothetical protein
MSQIGAPTTARASDVVSKFHRRFSNIDKRLNGDAEDVESVLALLHRDLTDVRDVVPCGKGEYNVADSVRECISQRARESSLAAACW